MDKFKTQREKLKELEGKFSLASYYCTALDCLDNTFLTPPRTRLDSNIYNGMSFIGENNGLTIDRFYHFIPFYLWLHDFTKNKYNGTERCQIRINAEDLDTLNELIDSGEFKSKYKFISDKIDLSDENYDLELLAIKRTLISWRSAMRRKSNKSPKEIWFVLNNIDAFPIK